MNPSWWRRSTSISPVPPSHVAPGAGERARDDPYTASVALRDGLVNPSRWRGSTRISPVPQSHVAQGAGAEGEGRRAGGAGRPGPRASHPSPVARGAGRRGGRRDEPSSGGRSMRKGAQLESHGGSAFISVPVPDVLQDYGVKHLLPPSYGPRYNASLESGSHWLKQGTEHEGRTSRLLERGGHGPSSMDHEPHPARSQP